jgi:xylitol oxidase
MRTIAADELWLSPFFERDSIGLHFTWRTDFDLVRPAVRAVQTALRGLAPRPHWGKVFFDHDAADFAAMYPRMADFRRLAAELDPDRHFANHFLERFVLG